MSAIDSTLHFNYDKEDAMKTLFIGARNVAQNEIADLLLDFRQKRSLGHCIIILLSCFVSIVVALRDTYYNNFSCLSIIDQ